MEWHRALKDAKGGGGGILYILVTMAAAAALPTAAILDGPHVAGPHVPSRQTIPACYTPGYTYYLYICK